ncbi:hypothetical protein ACQ4PT_018157 [Festuca glaucescens]
MPFSHFDCLGGDTTPPFPSGPGTSGAHVSCMDDIDEDSVHGTPPLPAPVRPRVGASSSAVELWRRVVARRQARLARAYALDDIDGVPSAFGSPNLLSVQHAAPVELWDRVLLRRLATQFPDASLDDDQVPPAQNPSPVPSSDQNLCLNLNPKPLLLQWYDTLAAPATPIVDDAAKGGPSAPATGGHAQASDITFPVGGEDHEDAVHKQRVRRKRVVDSALKAHRSSRLASKELANFVNMLTKAKAVKASRFDLSSGSPRLRAAATAAGFAAAASPGPIPLPRLRALAAACGIDPDAIAVAAEVPSESWNVRWLGDEDKCISVFADLSVARPGLLAIQESKLGVLTPAKAASFLPPFIRSHRAVDAVGTSGGLVSAWDHNLFSLASDFASHHILSLDLAFNDDGTTIRFSNVYAPCDRAEKVLFLELLASHDPGNDIPWIIAGDFNLTRAPTDRNNDNFSFSEAIMFNNAINNLCLFELPLSDRNYTWSNHREVPTLVRLDRVFINHVWNSVFPSSTLSSLARDTSDHVPLVATISTLIPKRGYFRYDAAWSLHAGFKNLIRSSWGVFDSFFDGSIDLTRINHAFFVLLPKSDGANTPSQFRPISLQNCIMKAITKDLGDVTSAPSFLDKIVREYLPLYRAITHASVVSGTSTAFWLDKWLPGMLLAERYPALFSHVTRPHASVASVISSSFSLQPRLSGAAERELRAVVSLVDSVTLGDGQDLCCIDSPSAPPFSSREAYRMLSPRHDKDVSACTSWGLLLPVKVRVFSYLADIDRLSTRSNLFFKNCAPSNV